MESKIHDRIESFVVRSCVQANSTLDAILFGVEESDSGNCIVPIDVEVGGSLILGESDTVWNFCGVKFGSACGHGLLGAV